MLDYLKGIFIITFLGLGVIFILCTLISFVFWDIKALQFYHNHVFDMFRLCFVVGIMLALVDLAKNE